jgi:hypothetical protein
MSEMCCPHCKAALALKQAIEILNGSVYQRIAKVELRDGNIAFIDAGAVNPKM